jgi:hypothetical protein
MAYYSVRRRRSRTKCHVLCQLAWLPALELRSPTLLAQSARERVLSKTNATCRSLLNVPCRSGRGHHSVWGLSLRGVRKQSLLNRLDGMAWRAPTNVQLLLPATATPDGFVIAHGPHPHYSGTNLEAPRPGFTDGRTSPQDSLPIWHYAESCTTLKAYHEAVQRRTGHRPKIIQIIRPSGRAKE